MNLKSIIAAIAVVLLGVIAYSQINSFLEQRHQIQEQRQAIKKSIAESTEGAAEILKVEVTSSSATFAELFDRGDDRIKKISDAIIPIGISSIPSDERGMLKTYMEDLQELLRLQIAKNRKILATSTAVDQAKIAQRDYTNETNEYGMTYARTRALNSLTEAKKDLEETKQATKAFSDKLSSVRSTLNILRPKLTEYDLIEDSLLNLLIQKQHI
jgi:hypothetical protein